MNKTVTSDQVIEFTSLHGLEISKTQLQRWSAKGLLPPGEQHALGQGKGSETRYPAQACQQALAVTQCMNANMTSRATGWHLWLLGFLVAECYWRPRMEAWAKTLDQRKGELLAADEQDDNEADLFGTARILDEMPKLSSPLGVIRRSLNQNEKNRFAEFIRWPLEILLGEFTGLTSKPYADDPDQKAAEVVAKIGLLTSKALKATVAGKSLFSPDIEVVFRELSDAIAGVDWSNTWEEASKEEILEARAGLIISRVVVLAFEQGAQNAQMYLLKALVTRLQGLFCSRNPDVEAVVILLLIQAFRKTGLKSQLIRLACAIDGQKEPETLVALIRKNSQDS